MADGSGWSGGTRRVGFQTVIQGDCLIVMASHINRGLVDIVVTSPPYNLNLAYSLYDDARTESDYVAWLLSAASHIKKVPKPDGSFFLNIAGSNSQPWLPFEIVVELKKSGFSLQNHITWIKSISMKSSSSGHFKPVGEKRFMHHNHKHIFHLILTNDVKLDRLSIGIPFQDKTNIARRGHERDLRYRGNRSGRLVRYGVSPSLSGSPGGWLRNVRQSGRCTGRA